MSFTAAHDLVVRSARGALHHTICLVANQGTRPAFHGTPWSKADRFRTHPCLLATSCFTAVGPKRDFTVPIPAKELGADDGSGISEENLKTRAPGRDTGMMVAAQASDRAMAGRGLACEDEEDRFRSRSVPRFPCGTRGIGIMA